MEKEQVIESIEENSPKQKKLFWERVKEYWQDAAKNITNTKMLVYAALICALRIAIKALKIPVLPGKLSISFDSYVNALGSLVYGPVVGLIVGAVSDTIGAIFFPTGAYFFPFIFVEMSSSFIFGLFLWKRKITVPRVVLAKFIVNLFCNIFLTSLCMKWMYAYFATDKTYSLINLVRIVKNLILFPLEGILICCVLHAFIPALAQLKLLKNGRAELKPKRKDFILVGVLLLLSVGLVAFYVLFLQGWLANHNIKLF